MAELIKYDAMVSAIAAAYEVDEVKDIRDKALALAVYARQAKNVENERRACEIRLRAERKAGQLLNAAEKHKGAASTRSRPSTALRLRDLGISKDQSADWQKLARIPEGQFEAALADPETKPTTANLITEAKPKQRPVDRDAISVWGHITEFKRNGLLDLDPVALRAEMLDFQIEDIEALIPAIIKWLEEFHYATTGPRSIILPGK